MYGEKKDIDKGIIRTQLRGLLSIHLYSIGIIFVFHSLYRDPKPNIVPAPFALNALSQFCYISIASYLYYTYL